jgi:Hint domain
MKRFRCFLAITILLAACSPGVGEFTSIPAAGIGTASVATVEPIHSSPLPPNFTPPPAAVPPTPTPIPTLPGGLGPTELKYRILAQFPDLFFCDPDFYPIARADEGELARQRFPELQANTEEFNTILAHNNLAGQSAFTDDQKLLIYRAHKKLAAIPLTLASTSYQFQIQVAKTKGQGEVITGLINNQGKITIQQRKPSFATCPICLAAGTRIDTPAGPVPVQNIPVGMIVWTKDQAGTRVASPVIKVSKTVVPANHQMVHLVLSDARELWVSPGHPTTDGRRMGQLREKDLLDGGLIRSIERVPYANSATYDLLPAGPTGFYWANGILIASTLK